jgi:tripartite-type tricarboxylate transporter receptor subunit TctC
MSIRNLLRRGSEARRNAALALGAVSMALLCSGAFAQGDAVPDFPQRLVTLVLPGPAGGGPDLVARSIADVLSKKWGQPVIVENKPGATGMIGAESVARGDASGHRLLFAYTALVQAPAVFAKVPYDLRRDFAPVMQVANAPVFLAVRADSHIQNLADYIAAAKNPAKPISFGSFGNGSSYHIYGEALKLDKHLSLLHVPYKGEALALQDLLGGAIDSTFVSVGTGGPYVRAGKIRAIALVGLNRSSVFPDVPTFHESGVQGLDAVGWFGLVAPAATPPRVIQKLAADIKAAVEDKTISTRLRDAGFEPVTDSDPVQFKSFIEREAASWKKLIAQTGVKPD